MASTALSSSEPSLASTSTSSVTVNAEPAQHSAGEERQPAGPLPLKAPQLVGEIGYSAETQESDIADGGAVEELNAAEADARNGQHPADASSTNLPQRTQASLQGSSNTNESTTTVNTNTTSCKFALRSLSIWSKKCKGISVKTIVQFVVIVLLLGGTSVAWAFAAKSVSMPSSHVISPIFLHLLFAILAIILIIFLERCIFYMRVERYMYLHPGQLLPLHRRRMRATDNQIHSSHMAFAPWNRPSLPTYAAALGHRGTGDVEDDIIAAPPPPEYGNTRGSTLLLATVARNTVTSVRSYSSSQSRRQPSLPNTRTSSVISDLPVSYDESEHHSDIERARILEEVLAKLESSPDSRT